MSFTKEQIELIERDGICPFCDGSLDTGFECLDCGANAWTGSKDPFSYIPKTESVFGPKPNPPAVVKEKWRF